MLFFPTARPKRQLPPPLPHHPTFLLETIFLSCLALMSAALLSRAISPPPCPAHTQPWMTWTEPGKRRFPQQSDVVFGGCVQDGPVDKSTWHFQCVRNEARQEMPI